jgi:threonine dehydrogenase-like Zn-dependent dehydrogenase
MKALQVVAPRAFAVVEAPIPSLAPGGPERILVRTAWVSMCGSDIPYFTGSKRFKPFPPPIAAPIHECVGQVVESRSSQFKPGDRVVAIPDGDQGLAEFFIAQATKATRLPDDVANWETCCLIQPLSTVMNAVDRLGDVTGQSVAVVGLGSIGLLFCWLLRRRGAGEIIGVDPSAHRCRMAERLGAARTLPQRSIEVVHAARRSPSAWSPPDICIEAVGHQTDTLNDCIELARKRGTILAFGVPDHTVYAVEFETFFRKNAHLIAVVTPEWSEYLPQARDLYLASRAELDLFITHRLAIGDATRAFTLYERHEDGIVKALIDASCWETGIALP